MLNNNVSIINGEGTVQRPTVAGGGGIIIAIITTSAQSSLPLKKEEKDTCHEREVDMGAFGVKGHTGLRKNPSSIEKLGDGDSGATQTPTLTHSSTFINCLLCA